jgi:hypothetical protein
MALPLDGHPEMAELGMKPRQQECRHQRASLEK